VREVTVKILDAGLKFKGNLQKRNRTDYIILHHSASSKASVEDIHNYHQKGRGWIGIGYNFYVRKDGSIYRGRPEDVVGAHTTGYNDESIGICAEGNFEKETMPEAQKRAIIELLRELKKRYPNAQIKRHKDFAATACPGKNYPFEEIVKEVEIVFLKIGSRGEEVKKLQESLNKLGFNCGTADGIFGPKTEAAVKAFQKANGLAVDGIVGPATQAKLEEMLRKMEEQANAQVLQARARQLEDELQQARNRVLILENELNKYKAIVDNVKKLVSEV